MVSSTVATCTGSRQKSTAADVVLKDLYRTLLNTGRNLSKDFFFHETVLAAKKKSESKQKTMAAPPTPQTFPYDYLFKVLIIGDASVGKVRHECAAECV